MMCARCSGAADWACFSADDYEGGSPLHERPDFFLCDSCNDFITFDADESEAARWPYDEALVIA